MHFLFTPLILGSLALQGVLARPGAVQQETAKVGISKRSVEDFIQSESPFALKELLCNIGADGCNAAGVQAGLVIASPSKQDPPYFYTWTRDSALVFKSLVDRFINSYDAGLQKKIQEYIASQAKLQTVSNPSGDLASGAGLGEAKYNVDGSAFTDAWGRPQRDGPALRAIAIMSYGEWLIDNSYTDTARDIVWPVVRNDLNYVAQYWNQTGFDLWEEVRGSSFFTVASQYKALVQGYQFAARVGANGSNYKAAAPSLLCFMQNFWQPSKGAIDSNINVNDGRTGLDANSILASIHTVDSSLGCDSTTFQPCSDKALSNLKAVVDSFRFYNINNGIPQGTAIAVGRYSEDVYYGGNPWYLNTLAVAEQLYDAIFVWKQQGSITITDVSRGFFADLVPSISTGTYTSGQNTYNTILQAVSTYADGFVNIVAKYARVDGSLDEQYSKQDGSPLSATDLTWSYASFLTTVARRQGVLPKAWSGGANTLPGSCSAVTFQGSYSAATATAFPASQTPITGVPPPSTTTTGQPPSTTTACSIAPKVTVSFEVRATTTYGQTIKVVGNASELGGWNTNSAVALSASDYTAANPVWKGKVVLPAGLAIQYKYINVQTDGSVRWEADPNRSYTVPQSCSTTASRSDKWQG